METKGGQPQIQQQETKPQGSPESQPQASVADILGRRAQLRDSWVQFRVRNYHQHTREYLAIRNEYIKKVEQLGEEVASLYPNWEVRDQLIFDLYTTSKPWQYGLSAQDTQAFIARIQSPQMTEDQLREEIRKAKEAEERKAAISKKIQETRRRNKNLTPEEQAMRQKVEADKQEARTRRLYERALKGTAANIARFEREERSTDPTQPSQVFPPPTKE